MDEILAQLEAANEIRFHQSAPSGWSVYIGRKAAPPVYGYGKTPLDAVNDAKTNADLGYHALHTCQPNCDQHQMAAA